MTSAAPHTFPSRPFSIFVALLWMLSNTFISFLLPGKEEKIPESQPGTPCDLIWEGPSNPGGLASSAGDGESLYDIVLRPPREGSVRFFLAETLLLCVPVAVCHKQKGPKGPWEDTAKASGADMKHQRQAHKTRWMEQAVALWKPQKRVLGLENCWRTCCR